MVSPDDPRLDAEAHDASPEKRRRRSLSSWLGPLAVACVALVTTTMMVPVIWSVRDASRKTVDGSNLRQITAAGLIYAYDHEDRIPQAQDVWEYAEIMAQEGILNDALFWVSGRDPANRELAGKLSTILPRNDTEPGPKFRDIKPTWAVALGGFKVTTMPPTVPIAWTRGLQPDGTWAAHSPYGSEGGHVAFLQGKVRFYRTLNSDGGELVRYDGSGRTGNILEALPPGTKISEYVPNEQEAKAWARSNKREQIYSIIREVAVPAVWLGTLLLCIVQASRRKWRWQVMAWFLFMTVLTLIIVPMLETWTHSR